MPAEGETDPPGPRTCWRLAARRSSREVCGWKLAEARNHSASALAPHATLAHCPPPSDRCAHAAAAAATHVRNRSPGRHKTDWGLVLARPARRPSRARRRSQMDPPGRLAVAHTSTRERPPAARETLTKTNAVLLALMLAPLAAALQPTLPTSTRAARPSTALQMVYGKTRASSRKFVPAVSQSELSPGKAVSGICAGLDICVAVDTDGSVYALGNKSPVLGTPMAAGRVAGGEIKDPLTGTSFSVKSGQVVGPWCPNFPFNFLFSVIEPQGLPVFKCKTGGGAVQVEVDVNAKTNFESGYWKGILDAQGKTDGGYY
jgi:nitrite reductase/ring-hydroxylating ferredoxin subunit